MVRVAVLVLVSVLTAGCGIGPSAVSTSFADTGDTPSLTPMSPSLGLGGQSATGRPAPGTQVAAHDDRMPPGSYETAPKGALADRDYSRTSLDPAKALALINQYRADKGLRPLKLNAQLTAAAKAHARDLAKWDRISHFGSDGSNPWDRVKRAGYKASLAAENVGTGQLTFQEVLRGWKESAGHNKNLLLADARHAGLALVQDPRTEFKSFWTLVIGASM